MIVESYEDVIILSGALRSNYWETLHTAISLTLKRHPTGVIIDCSAITEATPEGAKTFRDVMEFIHNHDARVIVAAVPEYVRSVLRTVAEVRSQLAIAGSVEEARRSLDLLVDDQPERRRTTQAESSEKILVLVTGQEMDDRAVLLAADLAEVRVAAVHLVYVVIVPRELPLTAPLPKEEAVASAAIDRWKPMLRDRHLTVVPHLERGRDVSSALEDLVETAKATMLIVPLSPVATELENSAKSSRSLLSRIPCDLVMAREPIRSGS